MGRSGSGRDIGRGDDGLTAALARIKAEIEIRCGMSQGADGHDVDLGQMFRHLLLEFGNTSGKLSIGVLRFGQLRCLTTGTFG